MPRYHQRFEHLEPLSVVAGADGTELDISDQSFYVEGSCVASILLRDVIFQCTLDSDGLGVTLELIDEEDESYCAIFEPLTVFPFAAACIFNIRPVAMTPHHARARYVIQEYQIQLRRRADIRRERSQRPVSARLGMLLGLPDSLKGTQQPLEALEDPAPVLHND